MSTERGGRYVVISRKQRGTAERVRYHSEAGTQLASGARVERRGRDGVTFGAPQAAPPSLRVLRVEGPFDENNQLVREIRRGKSYEYRATAFSRRATESELRGLRWAFKYDDGSIIPWPAWTARAVVRDGTVVINLAARGDVPERAMRIYAYFREPSEQVSVLANIARAQLPVVVDRYRKPGRNIADTAIADDMAWGNGTLVPGQSIYTEQQIHDLGLLIRIQMGQSDAALFRVMREMSTEIFSVGELEGNIQRMIARFQSNTGAEYTDAVLTRHVREHASTQRFCTSLEGEITRRLREAEGAVEAIEDLVYHPEGRSYGHPRFNTGRDTWAGGLTIAINDVWAYEVQVTAYQRRGANFSATYKVILFDHFGLDLPDVNGTLYYNLAGFRAWFVLQHLRSYKPFVVRVEFEKSFSGTL